MPPAGPTDRQERFRHSASGFVGIGLALLPVLVLWLALALAIPILLLANWRAGIAMRVHRMTFPGTVPWLGTGMDTSRAFRNVHSLALT